MIKIRSPTEARLCISIIRASLAFQRSGKKNAGRNHAYGLRHTLPPSAYLYNIHPHGAAVRRKVHERQIFPVHHREGRKSHPLTAPAGGNDATKTWRKKKSAWQLGQIRKERRGRQRLGGGTENARKRERSRPAEEARMTSQSSRKKGSHGSAEAYPLAADGLPVGGPPPSLCARCRD